jgi:hypothetical protein
MLLSFNKKAGHTVGREVSANTARVRGQKVRQHEDDWHDPSYNPSMGEMLERRIDRKVGWTKNPI